MRYASGTSSVSIGMLTKCFFRVATTLSSLKRVYARFLFSMFEMLPMCTKMSLSSACAFSNVSLVNGFHSILHLSSSFMYGESVLNMVF